MLHFVYNSATEGLVQRVLRFNPLDFGFSFDKDIGCCMYFKSDTIVLKVRKVNENSIIYDKQGNTLLEKIGGWKSNETFKNTLEDVNSRNSKV